MNRIFANKCMDNIIRQSRLDSTEYSEFKIPVNVVLVLTRCFKNVPYDTIFDLQYFSVLEYQTY